MTYANTTLHLDAPGEYLPSNVIFEYRKDGVASKMRSHKGNRPILPQTKLCPHCPAKFTRTTHLNRHLRTHTNERLYRCDTCPSQFTRSDLLTRHKRGCNDPASHRTRRKSCQACADSKIKCDLQQPCSKCSLRGKECVFLRRAGSSKHSSPSPHSTRKAGISTPMSHSTSSGQPATPSGLSIVPPSYCSDDAYSEDSVLSALCTPLDSDQLAFDLRALTDERSKFGMQQIFPALVAPSYSNGALGIPAETDANAILVRSHMQGPYENDVFEPLFASIFAQDMHTASTYAAGAENVNPSSPPAGGSGDEGFPFARHFEGVHGTTAYPKAEHSVDAVPEHFLFTSVPTELVCGFGLTEVGSVAVEPSAAELNHYLHLFFTAFLKQVPIVHIATWSPNEKPLVLIAAMRACGALFVSTQTANDFIMATLASARVFLAQEFEKGPTDPTDQADLILAVVLLQMIGLFHERSKERAYSNIYHEMLVTTIRRYDLIAANASWKPAGSTDLPIDVVWRDWARHETTKRALWLSYLHDCCYCIYFAQSPSYHPLEMNMNLPCNYGLWTASTAAEWCMALQESQVYGSLDSQLAGANMPETLSLLCESHLLTTPMQLDPFSHFILIHGILRQLFTVCTESQLAESRGRGEGPQVEAIQMEGSSYEKGPRRDAFGFQYALHNWLHNWLNSPEEPRGDADEEPPFAYNSLPLYWLGQVSLLAYQDGLPPFEVSPPRGVRSEARFRLMRNWLKQIRKFLCSSDDEASTLFWDELMKTRLETWHNGCEGDHQEGLLGFFPER